MGAMIKRKRDNVSFIMRLLLIFNISEDFPIVSFGINMFPFIKIKS